MTQTTAFIFDMDGTLVDNMGFHTQAWLTFLAELGIQMAPDEVDRRIRGLPNAQFLRQILGDDLSEATIARYSARKESIYQSLYEPYLKPIPGLEDFLAKAHHLAVPMAVATSAGQGNIRFILGGLGIYDTFGAIVGSEDVTHGKPHPEMFLKAARRLGVPVEQCLVFEDSLAGIEAARRAGIKAVAITTTLDAQAFKGLPTIVRVVPDYLALDPGVVKTWTADGVSTLQHTWTIEHDPSKEAVEALRSRLAGHNIALARINEGRELAVFIHDGQEELVGGIAGWIWGHCLEIDYLWVDDGLRGQGYGTQLLETLEREAKMQGCRSAIVDTYSFQAPRFYQKRGYELLGSVDGYPRDYQKLFLKKELA